jgi:ankyrin repeat domain-containing protein 50
MRLLSDFDVADYQAMLSKPARGTCQWILSHPVFVSWLETAGSALLWLTGHPGCGKTVLSLYLATQLETDLASLPSSNVCIFFCDDKITKHRDAKNALIGLIFQLVHRHPSLVRYVSRAYEMQGQSLFRSFTALWNIFIKIIRDPRYGPTYVIIDGLDECEMNSRFSLVESIRNVIQNPESGVVGKSQFKFFAGQPPNYDTGAQLQRCRGLGISDPY